MVAGVLQDEQGQVLITQRPDGKAMAGFWEFPGGKVERDETPEQALVRELREELALTVAPEDLVPFRFLTHDYERFHLVLLVYRCEKWHGEVVPQEHQAHQWLTPATLDKVKMLPADAPLITALQELYLT